MRKLLLGLLFVFTFGAVPVVYADEAATDVNTGEALPEIAPVDDAPIPALDAPAQE